MAVMHLYFKYTTTLLIITSITPSSRQNKLLDTVFTGNTHSLRDIDSAWIKESASVLVANVTKRWLVCEHLTTHLVTIHVDVTHSCVKSAHGDSNSWDSNVLSRS
jgi:hypothetical protein